MTLPLLTTLVIALLQSSSVYFDSYENNVDVVACLEKQQSLAMIEKKNTEHKCHKLIDVCDTEYG